MFLKKWPPVAILDVKKSLLTISDQYHNFYFCDFVYKMAAGAHFGWDAMSIIELVRDIWMNNACVKYEERSLNPSKVIALTTQL